MCIPVLTQGIHENAEMCRGFSADQNGLVHSALPRHTQRDAGEGVLGSEAPKFPTLSKCICLLCFDLLGKGWASFFFMASDGKYFGCVDHTVSVAAT